jgi:hypothetical protein
VATVLRYEMLFCGSIKAVVLSVPEPVDQIPMGPVPVAAVEPACGLVRLGSASPVTAGVDAAAGALAVAGALAAAGELVAEGDTAPFAAVDGLEPPPPPPQAARTSAASSDDINVRLYFISVVLFRRDRHVRSFVSRRSPGCSRFFP